MSSSTDSKIAETVAILERRFAQKVLKIVAPGGKGRASYRVHFADRSVIVTNRPNINRTLLEANVLRALSPICEDVPEFLGYQDGYLFQSDVGETRLSLAVQSAPRAEQQDLAAKAVTAIFRIQSAARKTTLNKELPHLGAADEWVAAVVDSVDDLAGQLHRDAPDIDRAALCAALKQPAAQFLKWDCRAGNASLDEAARLRWFDFEYSGLRHGAEDFAWLIGDEIWPVSPQDMFDIIIDAFDPETGHSRAAYMDYLALYTSFHAIQRILLILSEVKRRGWRTQEQVVRLDKVGAHPLLGARLAETAAFCADHNALTRPMRPMLEAVAQLFRDAQTTDKARLAS